ncbi:RNA polymerase sigma-70 factor (sigma-E family) [Actinocorallia herbida]|uniref:RNA polymerase sigma-70 factor (Sigma-E family) n=1 Tax=Actinocorallia herbida TaxID=58109 RepID=A0A3N1CZU5_9ACTN|nr:SigE family RNA polymerase sigma factor [Actinocorallia herbida]ROO86801.1 RNA polymerase sigma-70 factor (sigma-E family) [Actinocorallia herbida]
MRPDREFHEFFELHYRSLGRFAYLMLGDPDEADDLVADVFAEAWRHWGRVRRATDPLAYVRRMLVNLAATRVRGLVRERRGGRELSVLGRGHRHDPDVAALVDLQAALQSLPIRKRACVVLRLVLEMSEAETAAILGISVGTVKSQTARGLAQLQARLGVEG